MAYKPSDFAAGFGDVVSILFPGSVFAYAMLPPVATFAARVGLPAVNDGSARWVAFVVAAYLLGHLAFLVGALLDYVYNPIRKSISTPEKDRLFKEAEKVMNSNAGVKNSGLNVFKLSKAYLALRSPSAAADIARLEAESKFFRSLIVVLAFLIGTYWASLAPAARFWGLVLVVLAFWRYAERRWKSTEQAYALVVVDASGLVKSGSE